MANQVMTAATELAAIVPEIWSQKFLDVLRARLPFIDSVSKDWEGEIQGLGDTVKIPQIPDFSMAIDLPENANGDAESVTALTIDLVMNKRPYKDFIVTKLAQLQSIEFMDKLRDSAAYSIMKKMHADIIAATLPSTSAPDHTIAFGGATIAITDITNAKKLLDDQNVPELGRKALFGTEPWNELYSISGFTSRDFVPSGSPLSTAQFQVPLVGFNVDWTTDLGNVVYFFHPLYLTMAMQQQLNVAVHDLAVNGNRSFRVNADIVWGLKLLDNKRVVQLG